MQANCTRKPQWLRTGLGNTANFSSVGKIVRSQYLHTICESGRCPNKGECWNNRTATFLIAGEICTRKCRFCNTLSGHPLPLDAQEPNRIAQSVQLLGLNHVVVTSVCRDDLPDLGVAHWIKTIQVLRNDSQAVTIEALIPDFQGNREYLNRIIQTHPNILSHNMETVRRLTPMVRSRASYETSLFVLKQIADANIPAKSGFMLGLGETKDEVIQTMQDLFSAGCRLLSIGQYLQPSRNHLSVREYLSPERFEEYKTIAQTMNFTHVESAPLVRSSYHSVEFLNRSAAYFSEKGR